MFKVLLAREGTIEIPWRCARVGELLFSNNILGAMKKGGGWRPVRGGI